MNIANECQNSQSRPDQTIDPLTTSFRQLKGMVCSTAGQTLPSARMLRESEAERVFTFDHGDVTLTVYSNGFFVYDCNGKETVFAVDRCKQIIYEYQDCEIRRIDESEFRDGPCLIPLMMSGDDRLVHNMDNYEWYWHEFSLANNGEDWEKEASDQSAEDFAVRRETIELLHNSLRKLSKRQQEVVCLYHFDGMTLHQIANYLHLSYSTVRESLESGLRELRAKL